MNKRWQNWKSAICRRSFVALPDKVQKKLDANNSDWNSAINELLCFRGDSWFPRPCGFPCQAAEQIGWLYSWSWPLMLSIPAGQQCRLRHPGERSEGSNAWFPGATVDASGKKEPVQCHSEGPGSAAAWGMLKSVTRTTSWAADLRREALNNDIQTPRQDVDQLGEMDVSLRARMCVCVFVWVTEGMCFDCVSVLAGWNQVTCH